MKTYLEERDGMPSRRDTGKRRRFHGVLLSALVLAVAAVLSSDAPAARRGSAVPAPQAQASVVLEAPSVVSVSPAAGQVVRERKPDTRLMVVRDQNSFGIVDGVTSMLNIRSGPSTNADVIGYCVLHSALTITGMEGEWYRITDGTHTGYVHSDYVRIGEQGTALALSVCSGTAVSDRPVTAYSVPAVTGTARFTTLPGVRYEIDREYENWVRIVNEEDGTKGFVRCSDVSVRYTLNQPYFYTANDLDYQFRQSIINYAYQFLGLKYVWAGTSLTEGADCSGFVLRIYEHFRILLPRTSLSQSEFGTPVNSIAEAKVGDLIFYYGYSESGVRTEGVGHVAIYMGNGMIIHCARNSGVIVTPYDYRDQPLYIRRVIQ